MADEITKLVDLLRGEILSNERLSKFMAFGGGLGGGQTFIPDDPSVVWNELLWNHPFSMYVYRDMELKDDMVSSALETRKEAVLSDERFVKAASDKRQDKKVADFVNETLEGYMGGGDGLRFGFNNFLWEALDAIGKGVAIGENVFEQANDRVFIKSVNFKPQMLFTFAEGEMAAYQNYALPQTGPLRVRTDLGFGFEGIDPAQPLPTGKFFVHTFRPYQGDRWGSPQQLRAYWIAWFKKAGLKQSLRFLERGPGTVIAKYRSGSGPAEQDIALEAAQSIAEEASVAIPAGVEYDVTENVRGNMGSAHNEFLDRCDNGIARIFLGQTLTSKGSEGGGSRALGEVHERVAARKKEADALSLMLAVNTQLVFPIVLANIGPVQRPPIWMIKYQPGADLQLMSRIIYRAWQMKVPITTKFYYETMQLPVPAEGEEVIEAPSESDENSAIPGGDSDTSFAEGEEQKKKARAQIQRQALEAANLEEAALRDAAPVYDRILSTLIEQLDAYTGTAGVSPALPPDKLNPHFDSLAEILSDGLLASYLLGVSQVRQAGETPAVPVKTVQFADPVETAFNLPPKKAIDYFKAKKIVRKKEFNKLAREARIGAFTVGGVYKDDVLQGFKEELQLSLKEGRTQAQSIKRFHDILSGASHKQLGEFHLETVFRTNMQTAYGVGRRQGLEEVKEDLPIWTRHAVKDDRTRPRHAALDGVTYPADHEFWNANFAPDDFNCRCTVTASVDFPPDYDPKNPSGLRDEHGEPLAHVSYDDRGLPAKAEIGTTLYDLKVGNFNGIPPGATLLSAIEAGVKRGRQ